MECKREMKLPCARGHTASGWSGILAAGSKDELLSRGEVNRWPAPAEGPESLKSRFSKVSISQEVILLETGNKQKKVAYMYLTFTELNSHVVLKCVIDFKLLEPQP